MSLEMISGRRVGRTVWRVYGPIRPHLETGPDHWWLTVDRRLPYRQMRRQVASFLSEQAALEALKSLPLDSSAYRGTSS